eukprot:gene10134-21133_t
MCCLLCFDGSPLENDRRASNPNQFQISFVDALYKNQPYCCVAYCCPPCAAYYTRYKALDQDMTMYICCQGYFNTPCCQGGQCGESSCPEFCLCLESCCCLGPSVSSSRLYTMDRFSLQSDPCDNRLIRFSNCLQVFSCICDILSIFIRELRDCAQILDCIAQTVFYCMMG